MKRSIKKTIINGLIPLMIVLSSPTLAQAQTNLEANLASSLESCIEHFDAQDIDAREFAVDYIEQLRNPNLRYSGMNRIVTDSLMYHGENGASVCNDALDYHAQIAKERN